MELLTDHELKADLPLRSAMVRASMRRATRRIVKYNWYAAGHAVGVAPSVEEMIDYGALATVAYHDEGMEFGKALQAGIKLMSSWAYNEGKGVVTTAKVMVGDTGNKYAPGSVVGPVEMPGYDELEFNTVELVASLPELDRPERQALLMRAHAFTFTEIGAQLRVPTSKAEEIFETACSKARDVL
jgi:hypothetical protein